MTYRSEISGDRRYVVFESPDPRIVAGDTNGKGDIYLRDLRSGATERISVSTSGQQYAVDAYDCRHFDLNVNKCVGCGPARSSATIVHGSVDHYRALMRANGPRSSFMILTLPSRLRLAAYRSAGLGPAILRMAFCAVTLAVLAGCTTRWVVEHETSATCPTGRDTYHWQGGALHGGDAVDLIALQSVSSDIEKAVIRKLAAKGYRQVTSEEDAAIIVGYEARLGPATFNSENPSLTLWPNNVESTYASEPPQKRMTTRNYVTVVIDDPETRRVIWRGVVDEDVRVASTEHALDLVVAMAGDIARRVPDCRN